MMKEIDEKITTHGDWPNWRSEQIIKTVAKRSIRGLKNRVFGQ